MANPDDSDFEEFVAGILDKTFRPTSEYGDRIESDGEDILIHNVTESEPSDDETETSLTQLPKTTHEPTTPAATSTLTPTTHTSTVPSLPTLSHTPPTPDLLTPPLPVPPGPAPNTSTPYKPRRPAPPEQPRPGPAPKRARQGKKRGSKRSEDDGYTDVTHNDPGPKTTIPIFNLNKGINIPESFNSDTSPIDYFSLFFNEGIRQYICEETNHFANKRISEPLSPFSRWKHWTPITDIELKAFLGTVLNMGIIPLPNIESYFARSWESRIPFFGDVFSQREFLNIFWMLHFNHGQQRNSPKGFLIKPLVDHMKDVCKLFYTPGDFVAVDESTISFKGKVSFRVYNPQKPVKFGIKVFVLSDSSNGYIYDFIPYFGKEDLIADSPLLKTTQIVKLLTQSVILKDPAHPTTGLHVYTDRYYTSPELANELLDMKCYMTGTVMTHRLGLPNNMKEKGKKLQKGEILSERKDNLLILSWRDKRVVHMLSTKGNGSVNEMTDVPSKWPNKPPTKKPNVVLDYIKLMGGVDRSDHFISSYQFMRRTKKWYRKVFFWLLEVSVVNSYIIYSEVQKKGGLKPMSHVDFRRSLVLDLVSERIAQKPNKRRPGRPAQRPEEERLTGRHFLKQREKKWNRCVVCKKKGLRRETTYVCKTCPNEPPLHPDECFEDYHTKQTF